MAVWVPATPSLSLAVTVNVCRTSVEVSIGAPSRVGAAQAVIVAPAGAVHENDAGMMPLWG